VILLLVAMQPSAEAAASLFDLKKSVPGPEIVTATSPASEINRTRQPHLDLHARRRTIAGPSSSSAGVNRWLAAERLSASLWHRASSPGYGRCQPSWNPLR